MAHLVGSGVTTKWTGCGRLQDHKHDSRAVIGEERTISFGNQSPFSSLHDSPAVVLVVLLPTTTSPLVVTHEPTIWADLQKQSGKT